MADITFAEFWQRFTELERKTGSVKTEFESIQLYALLRVRIFYALTQELGIFEAPHPSATQAESVVELAPVTSLEDVGHAEHVVVPFKRRITGAEPYSDRIIELLKSGEITGAPVIPHILDFHDGNSAYDVQRLRKYFEEKYLEDVTKQIKGHDFARNTKKWTAIIESFENEFGASLEKLKKYPPLAMRRTLAEMRGFTEYFKACGAKNLYIVNAYSEQSIVLGAKLAGMKVHEIQHGFITAMHPAYAYPTRFGRRQDVHHAPDVLLTWGDFWTDEVPLPRNTEVVVTGPTETFIKQRASMRSVEKIPHSILFTSQGVVGRQLVETALNTAHQLPNHTVIYRLHPNESLESYQQMVSEICPEKIPTNFSLSHKDPSFINLVATMEYLVGAFSTTLYEGLALGCSVLVLPLPGFEHVARAIELGDMTLVQDLDKLPQYLAQAKPAQDPSRYYKDSND